MSRTNPIHKHIVIIGAGIIGTSVATMLSKVSPNWHIDVFERLDGAGIESSNEKNNAGTGHAALCELNYTVEQEDGSIDASKAQEINEQFEMSKQFWGNLVKNGDISNPEEFITPLPHISFVMGPTNVNFLRKRYETLKTIPMFDNIEYTEDIETMRKWMPLMMHDREPGHQMAASKIDEGTDVNYGELTRKLAKHLENQTNVSLKYNHDVVDLNQRKDGKWVVAVENRKTKEIFTKVADKVFIGAGGHSIPLLQKSGIKQRKHLGGFPISGQFLACKNEDVIRQHGAKVYSKEPEGKPPMTVPHLDTRFINGKKTLLFGPYANIGPRFLKYGSNLDLFESIKPYNITTMLASAIKNVPLIKYSIDQMIMTKEGCMNYLRTFIPDAKSEDWELYTAGKRVQVIKDSDEHGKGYVAFGTEVVNSDDHSMIALLGESPGASTSLSVVLEVLEKNFTEDRDKWELAVKKLVPTYGQSLINDEQLMRQTRRETSKNLHLHYYE